MAKLRFLLLLLLAAVAANAQRAWTVAQVEEFVKSNMKLGADKDHATAEFLLKSIKLTQKLDERTIEDLQGQGAGKETIRALHKLATDSASLPAPVPVVVAAPLPPPKPPSAQEQTEALAAIKEYALNYNNSLPNYVCTQITHRKQEQGVHGNGDTIYEKLTFFDHKETYEVEMVDNKAVKNVSHIQLGGVTSSGEFGSMLSNIFKEGSGVEFSWDHWATLRGNKRMYVFFYRIPKSNGYSMEDLAAHKEYTSAYQGLIYADHDTKAILEVTLDTTGIPADFPIHEVHIKLDYDHVKIGDQDFLLPYHYLLTSKAEGGVNSESQADFKSYRKYGAETSITFDETPIPEDQLKEQPESAAPKK